MKPKQIKQWSWTRYADYDKCPFLAKCKHIDKIPEEKGPPLLRGIAIHKDAEHYVTGEVSTLPASLKLMRQQFEYARREYAAGNAIAEEGWAFDEQWRPLPDFFDRRTWVRVKLDIVLIPEDGVVRPIDVKTGKVRVYDQQLNLYATAVLAMFHDVERVPPELWFVDHGCVKPEPKEARVYTPQEFDKLANEWERRTAKMLSDTRFDPNPGQYCRWCYVSKARGGPCKY